MLLREQRPRPREEIPDLTVCILQTEDPEHLPSQMSQLVTVQLEQFEPILVVPGRGQMRAESTVKSCLEILKRSHNV